MFSIYGAAGRLFNGPLEELQRVRRAEGAARVSAIADRELAFVTPPGGGAPAVPVAPRPPTASPGSGGAAAGLLAEYARAGSGPRHPLSAVDELMTRPALVLDQALSLREAWQQLQEHGHAQAPVLGAGGRLIGLVQRLDLAPEPPPPAQPWPLLSAELQAHWGQPVRSRMRTPVPAVAPGTDVRRVAQALLELGLPGLPVVDEAGAVLGFIARSDILRAVTHDPPLDLWA